VKTFRYNTLNVFSEAGSGGNPLAVFVSAAGLSDVEQQTIACDLQLSETVFVFPAQGAGHARLRIFTPQSELGFAGHPVLGTAWILGSHLVIPQIRVETGAGLVEVELERLGDILHRARVRGPEVKALALPGLDAIVAALGLTLDRAHHLPVRAYQCGAEHVFVEVGSQRQLAELEPNMARLGRVHPRGGVYAFCRGAREPSPEIHARYFAPGLGVVEDAATGSGAVALGRFLSDLGAWDGQESLRIRQGANLGHASLLEISRRDVDGERRALFLSGEAVVTGRGERMVRAAFATPASRVES
jgi:trans-2,3-dihydro-3-hydroxyanthranilate isomerase